MTFPARQGYKARTGTRITLMEHFIVLGASQGRIITEFPIENRFILGFDCRQGVPTSSSTAVVNSTVAASRGAETVQAS